MAPYDVVLFGATGFTGRLVVRYLLQRTAGMSLRWAIAGRQREKLEAVLSEAQSRVHRRGGHGVDILSADATDPVSVDNVVKSARVVISTAGPFLLHGTPVVEACVKHNVHYVDITGETPWVKLMVDKYHEKAAQNGTVLVPLSGFDSIPSDLGALFTAHRLLERTGKPARRIRSWMVMNGKLSGGTMATGILMEKEGLDAMQKQPFLLGGLREALTADEQRAEELEPQHEDVGVWSAPFMMAGMNTRVVRRTHMLSFSPHPPSHLQELFTRNFEYTERLFCKTEKDAKAHAAQLRRMPPAEKRQQMVEAGALPKPGEGPSEELRAKSTFHLLLVGEAADGETVHCSVSGGDPGYDETAKMVAESGLWLLEATQRCGADRPTGGFHTPASAGGLELIQRLHAHGILFKEHPSWDAMLAWAAGGAHPAKL